MRINELIVESQQIDELSLAGVGKGIGNAIRGTSTAVQGAKGAWQGAKDAWSQGTNSGTYDKARAAVSGIPTNQASPPGPQPVATNAAPSPTTPPASGTAPATTAPTTPPASGTAPATTAPSATTPSASPTTAPATTAPSAAPAAAPTSANTRVPVNIAKQDVDQAVNSVTKVRSRDRQNVLKYAKDKIDALQTAPAPTVEGVIYSKFLGQMI
jgi:hypothetical protein